MLSILWLGTLALKGFVVTVALWKRLFKKYPIFYVYLTLTALLGTLRFYFYSVKSPAYLGFYWWSQFLIVAVGFGVTWEIFGLTLQKHLGVRKIAKALFSSVFIALSAQFTISAATGPFAKGVMRLESHIDTVQIMFLLLLIALIKYYSVPLGRNLFGIIMGYGLYLSSNVAMLTLHASVGPVMRAWLNVIQQAGEIFASLIWAATLWQFYPNPIPAERHLDRDYAALASRTARAFASARNSIVKMLTL